MGLNWKGALAGLGQGMSSAGGTMASLGSKMKDKELAQAEQLRRENLAARIKLEDREHAAEVRDELRTYREGESDSDHYNPDTLKPYSNTKYSGLSKEQKAAALTGEDYLTKVSEIEARAKIAGEKVTMGGQIDPEYSDLLDQLSEDKAYRELETKFNAATSEVGQKIAQFEMDLYAIKKRMGGIGSIKITDAEAIKIVGEVEMDLPEPGSPEAKRVLKEFNKLFSLEGKNQKSYSQMRQYKINEATTKYYSDVSSVKGGRGGALGGPPTSTSTDVSSAFNRARGSRVDKKVEEAPPIETNDKTRLFDAYHKANRVGQKKEFLEELKKKSPVLYEFLTKGTEDYVEDLSHLPTMPSAPYTPSGAKPVSTLR